MRAIEFQLGATKLLDIRYGESNFKTVDEFWIDFKPDGGEKTTAFKPCVVKDTEHNRAVVEKIREEYAELKEWTDSKERNVLRLRHQLEK
jgi:hypothetical protein